MFVITSKSSSLPRKVRHDVKNTSTDRQDVRKCVMMSKTSSWRHKKCFMASNSSSTRQNTSWCQKVRHDIKTRVIISSWCQKIVMTSKQVKGSFLRYFLHREKLFDDMTNILTSCNTCWRHELLNIMTCFWCHNDFFEFMTCFWHDFLGHDKLFDVMTNLVTSWGIFDVMTCVWCYDEMLDVMTYFLTKWGSFDLFWRHDGFLTSWRIFLYNHARFDVMANFLTCWWTVWRHEALLVTSWRSFWYPDAPFDVMTIPWRIFDVMTFCWRHDVFLTSWRTIWRNDEHFDVMSFFWCYAFFNVMTCHNELPELIACFWRHDELQYMTFDVKTNFLTLGRVFDVFMTSWGIFDVMTCVWCHDEFLDIMTILWRFFTSWRCFYVITVFWHHDELFDSIFDMTYFWRVELFDVMKHLLTSWHTFWRYDVFYTSWWSFDVFLTSWRLFRHYDKLFGVITNFWTS